MFEGQTISAREFRALTSPYHGPEKSIRQFNAEHLMMSFEINTAPILNLAKHAQTALKASNQPIIVALSGKYITSLKQQNEVCNRQHQNSWIQTNTALPKENE